MPASVPVDLTKQMSALTADEQTAACAEFSRALTVSYNATPDLICRSISPNPSLVGGPACHAVYDSCLQSPPAPVPIPYCIDKMSIWSCPITIGQYQDCFNSFNAAFFALNAKPPACTEPDANTCGTQPASGACAGVVGTCDYVWYD